MKQKTCMIISAAGLSSRAPTNKLLMELNQHSVIESCINTFTSFELDITVVVGHEHEKVISILSKWTQDRIRIVYNPDYRTGMASSIRTAVKSVEDDYLYIGFCNGDKPFIQSATVGMLLGLLADKLPLILAPSYDGQLGHPNFFSTQLRAELLSISGDTGGKFILQDHLDETLIVPVKDEGVVLDMDRYLDRQDAN